MRDGDGGVPAPGPLVAVPLYRAPELVPGLIASLCAMAGELRAIGASVLFVNDSPDDAPLAAVLRTELPRLSAIADVELLVNDANLGFVRSANRAMALAHQRGLDVLLLNSDTIPRPGAFAEMAAVAALDPMIGSVCPRSDNATICHSPYVPELRAGGLDRAYAAHLAVARHLPRITYAPTSIGFCMLIRWLMLEEFGLFDEIYGQGYNEEADYVRRFNRRGYRAVLANHAYVHHIGNVSFAQTAISSNERDEENRLLLIERYPEAPRLVQRYFESADYAAQRLTAGLVPTDDGRLRLLFDCRKLELYYSGTHEHVVALLRAFAMRHAATYEIHVACEAEAFGFHALDAIPGLAHCPVERVADRPFAAVFRPGQPFDPADLPLLVDAAPIAGVLMLDTIALDCQQLDETNLALVWERMARSVDVIGFNSGFSADQFARRFAVPARVGRFVSMCSTDVTDYDGAVSPPGDAVLVVGNHFPHKNVAETVAALRAIDAEREIVVLGVAVEGVESHVSGLLSAELVASLYDRAGVVMLPSHYEGFGLPILHALARGRPVVVRDLPSAREIRTMCPQGVNLHLAATTRAMGAIALSRPAWREPDPAVRAAGWGEAADAIAGALGEAIAGFDYATCRARVSDHLVDEIGEDPTETGAAGVALPPIGQGFMLGRQLVDAIRQPRVLPAASWLDRLRPKRASVEHDADEPERPPAGSLDALCLRTSRPLDDLPPLARDILSWMDAMRPGARLRVRFPDPAGEADTVAARAVLLACGIAIDETLREGGSLIVGGTKDRDWRGLLPGPEGDRGFVDHLYRQTLGRRADREGAVAHLRALTEGCPRAEMLRSFLTSGERLELICRLLARAERA